MLEGVLDENVIPQLEILMLINMLQYYMLRLKSSFQDERLEQIIQMEIQIRNPNFIF
jgi:hypothetical protein